MSVEMTPYMGAGLVRDARRAGRAISRYRAGGQVRIGQIDTETDVAIGEGDALTYATGSLMGDVVRVAQGQRQLEQLAPEVAGRLALLADSHCLAMSDLLHDLRRELRRR